MYKNYIRVGKEKFDDFLKEHPLKCNIITYRKPPLYEYYNKDKEVLALMDEQHNEKKEYFLHKSCVAKVIFRGKHEKNILE